MASEWRAGSPHSSPLQRSHVTSVHIIPHCWHGLWMLVLPPSSFMCPLLKFLSSFVSRLSFPSTSWLCLKISRWRQGGKYIWVLVPSVIKFGWQLHWSNWAPMSALRSVVIILLLLLVYFLFWCCKIQWRGSKTADSLLLKLQSILLEIGFCVGYKTFSYNFISSIHFINKRFINISLWG